MHTNARVCVRMHACVLMQTSLATLKRLINFKWKKTVVAHAVLLDP